MRYATHIYFRILTVLLFYFFFFFNDTATTEIYTLSLHDALPICAALYTQLGHHGAWAAGSDAPEKKEVRIGFIPLTTNASAAAQMGITTTFGFWEIGRAHV